LRKYAIITKFFGQNLLKILTSVPDLENGYLVDLARASAEFVVAPVGGWPVEQVFWAPALRQTCHSIKGKLLGVRAGTLLEYPIALLITWVGLKIPVFLRGLEQRRVICLYLTPIY
jgi:hypothetical protein